MKNINNCQNCGAPITTEICPYCNAFTGLDTTDADMEYPVINCKEANINFWNTIFPMIFVVAFFFSALMFGGIPLLTHAPLDMIIPFLLIGLFELFLGGVALYIALKPIVRYRSLKRNGREIEATVYGYMNDNLFINEKPAQIVKLLVNTGEGPKFILYQLGDTKKPYKINNKIKLKVYKDIFLIVKEDKYYF